MLGSSHSINEGIDWPFVCRNCEKAWKTCCVLYWSSQFFWVCYECLQFRAPAETGERDISSHPWAPAIKYMSNQFQLIFSSQSKHYDVTSYPWPSVTIFEVAGYGKINLCS